MFVDQTDCALAARHVTIGACGPGRFERNAGPRLNVFGITFGDLNPDFTLSASLYTYSELLEYLEYWD